MGRVPTPEDFPEIAERMITEMRAQGAVGNIAYDRENQRLICESTGPLSVAGLAAILFRAQASETSGFVQRYVAAHLRSRKAPETWEDARGLVLPKIDTELEHVSWPLRSRLEGIVVPARPTGPVTEHLRLRFVWEVEDAHATVMAEDVERWGVTLDQIQDAAAENLLRKTPRPVGWLGSPESPGVYLTKWRDGFDATRVVTLMITQEIPAMGPLAAIATGDSTVFLADSTNEAALFQLGLAAQRQVGKKAQMLWLWPLLLDGEDRRHWLPDPSSSAFAPLSTCAATHASIVHGAHGQLLQRVLEAEGSTIQVAPVRIMQSPFGAAATVSVWSDGPEAAIAKTDYVRFQRGPDVLAQAAWPQVCEVLGDALREIPGYPTRYHAVSFPEDWQLSQLVGTAPGE